MGSDDKLAVNATGCCRIFDNERQRGRIGSTAPVSGIELLPKLQSHGSERPTAGSLFRR
jgi:hypothetical protein